MKFIIKTAGKTGAEPPENADAALYVRRSGGVFAAYYAVTSLAVGFGFALAMLLCAISDRKHHLQLPHHAPALFVMTYVLAVAAVVGSIVFLIQLITGPLVFTKNVVCRKCHRRFRATRIAFFTGRYSRPPKCECGGKVEPAFLWRPEKQL